MRMPDWYDMSWREAPGLLWSAMLHIKESSPDAWQLMAEIRDNMIDNPVDDEKTMWLYARKYKEGSSLAQSNPNDR